MIHFAAGSLRTADNLWKWHDDQRTNLPTNYDLLSHDSGLQIAKRSSERLASTQMSQDTTFHQLSCSTEQIRPQRPQRPTPQTPTQRPRPQRPGTLGSWSLGGSLGSRVSGVSVSGWVPGLWGPGSLGLWVGLCAVPTVPRGPGSLGSRSLGGSRFGV
jgi:hypothetical protein